MRDARGVRVVVRLERDDLVARLAQREQRRGDRLGRARGDEHLGVGVVARAPYHCAWCAAIACAQLGDADARVGTGCGRRGWRRRRRRAPRAGRRSSGKPWPRLIEPVATASADISAKIVVPKPCMRSTRYGDRGRSRSAGHEAQPHVPARVVAVEVDEHDALPGAEQRLAVVHRQRRRSARRSPAARGRRRARVSRARGGSGRRAAAGARARRRGRRRSGRRSR